MLRRIFNSLRRDNSGAFTIEVALVTPILATMVVGTFEAGSIVSRQLDLQATAQESETIALAVVGGGTIELEDFSAILRKSTGLTAEQVSVTRFYRCNSDTTTVTDPAECPEVYNGSGVKIRNVISAYLQITLADSYTPNWTKFGIGKPINFRVERTVMLASGTSVGSGSET